MRPARSVPSPSPRTERLEARIPSELKDLYTRAAAVRGQTLTDFVVSTVTDVARRIVRESDMLELSQRDQLAFATALVRPPPPSTKLQAAAAWARDQAEKDE